jgi:hypothetical protein
LRRIFPELLVCLAALPGCIKFGGADSGAGGLQPDYEFAVECIGMTVGTPGAGFNAYRTRFGGRCVFLVSSDVDGPGELTILDGETIDQARTASVQIIYGEDIWVARQGTVRLDQHEPGKGSGAFEVVATSATDARVVRMVGPFDFCDYGRRTDCPYLTGGGLTKRVRFMDPDGYTEGGDDTFASDCRVLIDRASGGVQVDLQIGVFNGVAVSRWQDQCDLLVPPRTNGFVFRSGGVTGPGTYGPFATRRYSEQLLLPWFELRLPLLYYGGSGACLTLYNREPMVARASEGTTCTYTISESPGTFELDCTDAEHAEVAPPYLKRGDFHLEADCDVRYR